MLLSGEVANEYLFFAAILENCCHQDQEMARGGSGKIELLI